jgi:quinol monooxygenase YgiN
VKKGRLAEFLGIFKSNVSAVRQERGCIEYYPAIDVNAELPTQKLEENVVVIIEKWESLEALRDHSFSPHMLHYKEKVKELVEGVSLKVLEEA